MSIMFHILAAGAVFVSCFVSGFNGWEWVFVMNSGVVLWSLGMSFMYSIVVDAWREFGIIIGVFVCGAWVLYTAICAIFVILGVVVSYLIRVVF